MTLLWGFQDDNKRLDKSLSMQLMRRYWFHGLSSISMFQSRCGKRNIFHSHTNMYSYWYWKKKTRPIAHASQINSHADNSQPLSPNRRERNARDAQKQEPTGTLVMFPHHHCVRMRTTKEMDGFRNISKKMFVRCCSRVNNNKRIVARIFM